MEVAILLFDDFETLDVFGPVEIFGRLADLYSVKFYSMQGRQIKNKHGINMLTDDLENINYNVEVFLIPGGPGTRTEVNNELMLEKIKAVSELSNFVLTVCTGSALLAKTGLLDNRQATSNKRAFSWVETNGPEVIWNKQARWVIDGKYYTSSGVSAGMDMALGFLADRHGKELAKRVAFEIEYKWVDDKDNDTFKVM